MPEFNLFMAPQGYWWSVGVKSVIDADHQNSCLFTNKGHFSLPLWILIGVLAKFHE